MRLSAGRVWRIWTRGEGKISLFEGRGASFIDTFPVHPLSFSCFLSLSIYLFLSFFLSSNPASWFFSWFPSGREDRADYNQRAHKSASIVLFSPPACLSIFSKADDEKEDKLVGKSFRCCANTPAGESAGWPSRGGRFGVACGRRGC